MDGENLNTPDAISSVGAKKRFLFSFFFQTRLFEKDGFEGGNALNH